MALPRCNIPYQRSVFMASGVFWCIDGRGRVPEYPNVDVPASWAAILSDGPSLAVSLGINKMIISSASERSQNNRGR